MLTCTIVVLLATLAFQIDEARDERAHVAMDLELLARLVSSYSTAALTFGDHQAATEVLNALRADPSIVAACIYTAHGEQFALYAPSASTLSPTFSRRMGSMSSAVVS